MKDLYKNIVPLIGLIAAVIGIFAFTTGYTSVNDIFKTNKTIDEKVQLSSINKDEETVSSEQQDSINSYNNPIDTIITNKQKEAYSKLNSYELFLDNSGVDWSQLNTTLTRAEYTCILCTLFNRQDEARYYPFSSEYSDVENENWYTPYVAYVNAQGWMINNSDSHFYPNKNITKEEINNLMLNLLDYYEEDCNTENLVQDLGVNYNNYPLSEEISKGQFYEVLYNTLQLSKKDAYEVLGVLLGLNNFEITY